MQNVLEGKEKEWAKIVAQAWVDEAFKQKLLAEPLAVLKTQGINLPAGIDLKVVEAMRGNTLTMTIPPKPPELSGSVEELSQHLDANAAATFLCIPVGICG